MNVCYWPILLKKSVRPNSLVIDWLKRLFCTLLREIRVRKPLPKVKISISDAYFCAAQTMVDFFNRIGRLQSVTIDRNRAKSAHQKSRLCFLKLEVIQIDVNTSTLGQLNDFFHPSRVNDKTVVIFTS